MSNLLENILINSEKIKFDFSKSIKENTDSNINYFNNDLPVEPKKSEWVQNIVHGKEMLIKEYFFKSYNHMEYFLIESLNVYKEKQKNIDIKIINKNIKVSLYTEDIDAVSDMDLEMSKYLDEIYNDIIFIEDL